MKTFEEIIQAFEDAKIDVRHYYWNEGAAQKVDFIIRAHGEDGPDWRVLSVRKDHDKIIVDVGPDE